MQIEHGQFGPIVLSNRKAIGRELAVLVDRQEAAGDDVAAFAAANVEFHERLVAASGNQTLVLLAEVLHDLVAGAVTQLTEQATATGARARRRGIKAQRRLLALVEAGDADAAEAFWRDHMERVAEIMLRGSEPVDHTRV